MKYKLKDFAADNGLTMEKNACYGIYGGYYVHVKYSPLGNPRCLISVVTRAEEKKGALEKFLARHAKEMRLADFGVVARYSARSRASSIRSWHILRAKNSPGRTSVPIAESLSTERRCL